MQYNINIYKLFKEQILNKSPVVEIKKVSSYMSDEQLSLFIYFTVLPNFNFSWPKKKSPVFSFVIKFG